MYKCANKLIHFAFLIAMPLLLSACGGAPASDSSTDQPSSTIANKPEVSSSATSINTPSSISAPSISSAITIISSTSSKSVSSEQSYSRISRASNSSASSQETPAGFDLIAPEVTKLQLYRLAENSITLVWDEAFDNVGISHYKIERNGTEIALMEPSINILSDQNLLPYTDYTYTITAFDIAGNDSGVSPAFRVRTLAHPNSSQANSSTLSSNSSSLSNSNSSMPSSKSSLSNSNSSVSSSSKSSAASSQKLVKITWTHPNHRENGEFLELDQIRGYEIRYRKTTDNRYTYIVINSNRVNEYAHSIDAKDTEFEIAVFDTDGVYSRFVKVAE